MAEMKGILARKEDTPALRPGEIHFLTLLVYLLS
jgi:hypothetical protein